jgi:hypothetical protein
MVTLYIFYHLRLLSCQNNYPNTVLEVGIMANKILSSSYDTRDVLATQCT